MNLPTHTNQPLTMSSREIAELLEVRHDSVKRTIERLVSRNVIVQPPMVDEQEADSIGRTRKTSIYKIGKRDSYVIVAQLSPEFTARLVDRWQQLETQNTQLDTMHAIPQTLPDALRLAADLADQKTQAEALLLELQPKVQAFDRLQHHAEGDLCVTDAAKCLKIKPKKLFTWLQAHQWIYRRSGGKHWIAYQNRIQSGVLFHKITTITKPDGTEKVCEQVLITPKGLAKIAKTFELDAKAT